MMEERWKSGTTCGWTWRWTTTTTTTRSMTKFNTTRSRSGTSTQFDTLSKSELVRSVCGIEKSKSDHYHREAPQPMDGDVARIQRDFMFIGAEKAFVEPRAKATILMVMCKDDGNLSATEVRAKTDEYGVEMFRFLSSNESVEIKTDGAPSTVEIARRVQARREKTTTLAQTSVGGHQEIGAVKRANGTVQAQLRAYFLDVQNRMTVRIIPGTLLFPWMSIASLP